MNASCLSACLDCYQMHSCQLFVDYLLHFYLDRLPESCILIENLGQNHNHHHCIIICSCTVCCFLTCNFLVLNLFSKLLCSDYSPLKYLTLASFSCIQNCILTLHNSTGQSVHSTPILCGDGRNFLLLRYREVIMNYTCFNLKFLPTRTTCFVAY